LEVPIPSTNLQGYFALPPSEEIGSLHWQFTAILGKICEEEED